MKDVRQVRFAGAKALYAAAEGGHRQAALGRWCADFGFV